MLHMLHSCSTFFVASTLPAGRKDPELPLKALGVLPPRGTASKRSFAPYDLDFWRNLWKVWVFSCFPAEI